MPLFMIGLVLYLFYQSKQKIADLQAASAVDSKPLYIEGPPITTTVTTITGKVPVTPNPINQPTTDPVTVPPFNYASNRT